MKSAINKTARTVVLATTILGSVTPILRADEDKSKYMIDEDTAKAISTLVVLKREEAIEKIRKALKSNIESASIPELEVFASRLRVNTIEEINRKTSEERDNEEQNLKSELHLSLGIIIIGVLGAAGIAISSLKNGVRQDKGYNREKV
jgi:hypothetical protein